MTEQPSVVPPSVTVQRKVEWYDTDAAGHHHHGAVLRWAEAAEAELLGNCGLAELYGRIPRVHYDVDYHNRLWFGQVVTIRMRVTKVGTTSVHYAFDVHGGAEEGGDVLAATGTLVMVLAAPDSPKATPLPAAVRTALTEGTAAQDPAQRAARAPSPDAAAMPRAGLRCG